MPGKICACTDGAAVGKATTARLAKTPTKNANDACGKVRKVFIDGTDYKCSQNCEAEGRNDKDMARN